LLENRPNAAAKDAARLACEMFLKCFLSHHQSIELDVLSDKPYGHNLKNILQQCRGHSSGNKLDALLQGIDSFPKVGDRYSGKSWHLAELWYMYGLAQFAATSFIRTLTNYDTRSQLAPK
jgi:hypothetical protein